MDCAALVNQLCKIIIGGIFSYMYKFKSQEQINKFLKSLCCFVIIVSAILLTSRDANYSG